MAVPDGQPLRPVHALAFAADGRTLVTGSRVPERWLENSRPFRYDSQVLQGLSAAVRLWDVTTGTERQRLPGPAAMALPDLVAVPSGGNTLAAGGVDGSVWLWDLDVNRLHGRVFVSPQAETYVTGVEAIRKISAVMRPVYGEGVQALALSPDGRLLVTAGTRGSVTVWETDSRRPLRTLLADGSPTAWAAFTPDGGRLALARGGQVQLWDSRTGTREAALGATNDPPLTCGAFLPGGSVLAVGTVDRRIHLWDLPGGKVLRDLIGHHDRITHLLHQVAGVLRLEPRAQGPAAHHRGVQRHEAGPPLRRNVAARPKELRGEVRRLVGGRRRHGRIAGQGNVR
jgi:WD40 repeat protein